MSLWFLHSFQFSHTALQKPQEIFVLLTHALYKTLQVWQGQEWRC